MRLLFTVPLLLLTASLQAAPVTWNIDSLLFNDGGSGYGSFTYDADTYAYSDLHIVTTQGGVLNGAVYEDLNPSGISSGPSALFLVESIEPDMTGVPGMQFIFATGLTNAGGTISITEPSFETFCGDLNCFTTAEPRRSLVAGQISSVPVPAAVWLFGSALVGLGWLRRKQTV
jgi:hypothetical protein